MTDPQNIAALLSEDRVFEASEQFRARARGRALGDVTTLANAEIVDQIHTMVESGAGAGEE